MPVLKLNELIEDRVSSIREHHHKHGIPRAQLDVSGGVDSAVMLGLLARAVGPENITAVYSNIHSSDSSRERACETAETFGVKLIEIDLSNIVDELSHLMVQRMWGAGHDPVEIEARCAADATIMGSIRSCIRAPIGRGFNRLAGGGIRHGTGNECEDRWLRFFQKGGDGEVDTNPIAMLSKGEVYQLAVGLGVPQSALNATPSPDLQGVGETGHNDEDELRELTGVPWTYSRVDPKTGKYISVGTIERLSRMADSYNDLIDSYNPKDTDERFFLDHLSLVQNMCLNSQERTPFAEYSSEELKQFILSARKMEQRTRHKMNPNCPTLGNRKALLSAGILTNDIKEIGHKNFMY
jgi:NAD+ synthetase